MAVNEQEGAGRYEEAVDGGDESQHEKQWKGDYQYTTKNTKRWLPVYHYKHC